MHESIRWLPRTIVLACIAIFASMGHASTLLDFEDPSLVGIYEVGDFFDQSGFRLTQSYDYGIVDTGDALGDVAPTNDSTQFYASLNDGSATLTRADGGAFNLDGFSAAYVPTEGAADANTMVLILNATAEDGTLASYVFSLGDTTSNTQGDPFFIYGGSFFSQLTDLVAVDFFTCDLTNGQLCDTPISNTAGFALDNIEVTPVLSAVPEPATYGLMALGLLSIVGIRRFKRQSFVLGEA